MTTKLVVDCSTGIVEEIELTVEEIAQRESDALAAAQAQAEREAEEAAKAALKESARNKLISGQPLSEEEAALLIL